MAIAHCIKYAPESKRQPLYMILHGEFVVNLMAYERNIKILFS